MKTLLRGKDWIETVDWTKEELETALEVSKYLKIKFALGEEHRLLQDKTLFMMFFEQSTRTRNSTEAAMTQLGGHAHDLTPDKMQISHGETPKDTGRVLSRYGHGIAIRNCFYGIGNKYIREVAKEADIPVVNLQCDVDHPCQSIADLMTIQEKFSTNSLKGLKVTVAWTYAPAYARPLSVPQGLITLLPRFGADVTLAYPPEFKLMPKTVADAERFAKETGSKFEMVNNMDEAFKNADVVYPKSWGCHQYLAEKNIPEDDKKKIGMEYLNKYKDWVCTVNRMKLAKKEAIYMHPLPADRGYEVEDGVIDGPQSVVFDQAENRLHTVKAILALIMGGRP
ncbi:MAG: ornithine carbamoyltransferase [Elusimicrobiales bacterium]|jgi:ornithine carbamoyltransferase|nr:ornithine carbamoyltransferase [Elusimicrobiales bacterium]NLH39782.1 ornithine carbamoyltransferase [Elusimicrobiota bacterium]